jgi:hypothetical protein
MAQKRYKVILTKDEETTLHAVINKGKRGAQKRIVSPRCMKPFQPMKRNGKRTSRRYIIRPNTGSRLNMAEIELNVINNQGLSGRMATI